MLFVRGNIIGAFNGFCYKSVKHGNKEEKRTIG